MAAQELYWEEAEILVPDGARFPMAAQNAGRTAVIWHEFEYRNTKPYQTSVSIMVLGEDGEWETRRRAVGPFPFVGEEVPYASVAINRRGEIAVAVASSGKRIDIHLIGPEIRRIASLGSGQEDGLSVAPRLFSRGGGGFILCATKTLELDTADRAVRMSSLGINYSVSEDGRSWSGFQPLVRASDISYVYLPSHASWGGKDYIIFQGSPMDSRYYQLFLVSSDDGGLSWSEPVRVTDFSDDLGGGSAMPSVNFDNQRPNLNANYQGLHLVWERRFATSTAPQIYYGILDGEGNFLETPERISTGNYVCRNPQTVFLGEDVYISWFDNRKGDNRVFVAYRQGISWQDMDLSIMPGDNLYGQLFVLEGQLNALWENQLEDRSRLVLLEPDRTVRAPAIVAVNFRRDARNARDNYIIEWNIPEDSSGIAGFNYSIDRDPEGTPERTMKVLRSGVRRTEAEVLEDGWWYFHVIARDYAGNWSQPATVRFYRDTTPPPAVQFLEPQKDEDGYLISNTLALNWKPPEAEDVEGYTYRLQYLSGPDFSGDPAVFSILSPPGRNLTREPTYSFWNLDNGLWAFSVAALDEVGNISPVKTLFFRLNKYIPVTYITKVGLEKDQLNRYQLQISGRGFSVGGTIRQVMLDRDGKEPYDYVYSLESGLYTVRNDRLITGPFIDQIDEGSYLVGVVHPSRGTYFTGYTLSFESTGTVKFGDFTLISGEKAPLSSSRKFIIYGGGVTFLLVMVLLAALLIFAAGKLTALVGEGIRLRRDVRALLENRELSYENKKEKLAAMKKRGIGLRIKFALLITFLVLIIVLMVAVPLGNYMIETQQRNLTTGLQGNIRVLIESLNAGAEKYLPEENNIELGRLPRQMKAAEDALFVTITGPPSSSAGEGEGDFFDYLWASNDPEIEKKVESTGEGEMLRTAQAAEYSFPRGKLKVRDEVSEDMRKLREEIDEEAREKVGALAERLTELQAEARKAVALLSGRQDQDTAQLLRGLEDEINRVNSKIEEELAGIGDRIGAVPEFDPEKVLTGPTEYTFYRPIVYQDSSREGIYYHGMVRLGISTERIVAEIMNSRDTLIRQTAVIALIAIGLGILGALLLATIILIPIRRLVQGVEKIRDTEDKEELKGHEIKIKSRDEIAILADTVNDMTRGLVNAAVANKDLIFGKEIQKMFIPLEQNSRGRKLTTGAMQSEQADFFGYYEGAKGVSGDYFDYMEVAEGRYSLIKCDVAGKGVAASLIMVEVATIFRSFFNDWIENQKKKDAIAAAKKVKRQEEDPNIEDLVYSINRLVQERGFTGRFAALIVVLLDVRSGRMVLCNAGDNLVHLYNSEKGAMETKTLPEAPAAGVFPNDLVEMQSGFKRIPQILKKNDMILLFTDGLEESQRHFRDSNFQITQCREEGLGERELHGNHAVGTDNEEFGLIRVYGVINALMNRGIYRLEKYHNPVPQEELVFDFSSCEGTIEDVVIAAVSVEKVFRMYPDPAAGEKDLVVVDRRIEEFLREHFLQYENYFGHPVQMEEEKEEYLHYSHIREDSQYDDLTILGVKKK
jgi:hypothetical protein